MAVPSEPRKRPKAPATELPSKGNDTMSKYIIEYGDNQESSNYGAACDLAKMVNWWRPVGRVMLTHDGGQSSHASHDGGPLVESCLRMMAASRAMAAF